MVSGPQLRAPFSITAIKFVWCTGTGRAYTFQSLCAAYMFLGRYLINYRVENNADVSLLAHSKKENLRTGHSLALLRHCKISARKCPQQFFESSLHGRLAIGIGPKRIIRQEKWGLWESDMQVRFGPCSVVSTQIARTSNAARTNRIL